MEQPVIRERRKQKKMYTSEKYNIEMLLKKQCLFFLNHQRQIAAAAAAAAAKSLQSCPTLCDPIDSRPPGSSTHGIFQARALEWGAIAFSGSWYSTTFFYPAQGQSEIWPVLLSLMELPFWQSTNPSLNCCPMLALKFWQLDDKSFPGKIPDSNKSMFNKDKCIWNH